jgi:hypothetical protein
MMYVDPPSGWMYGFPKIIPLRILLEENNEGRAKWFLDQGYPQALIDDGMLSHCRYWRHNESE